MKALIFAAGLGERMRPLSNTTPKPLLKVGGKPLIVWHLEKLAAIGVSDVVVNTSWLAQQFPHQLGNGARWRLRLHYSYEGPTPLETGGGMLHALALLGKAPFLAINGDIWTDFDFSQLPQTPQGDAHLVLVDNPPYHPHGDFALGPDGQMAPQGPTLLTFSGIGVYHPGLLEHWRETGAATADEDSDPPRFKLAPLLRLAMARNAVTGEHHRGRWNDVGTPERLAALDAALMLDDGPA